MNDPTMPAVDSFASTAIAGELAPPVSFAAAPVSFAAIGSAARTTVLPRVQEDGTVVSLRLESRSRYEPTKLLGAGGMGEVVLVRDHDIERKVALKRLLPELTEPALLARFVDEIRTVGRLEHPNIVPIHDVGVDELGRYFFVMKYVEGETLEDIIQKLAAGDPAYTARYPAEARIELFLGLLHALEYAHAQGVVHRDVKPANVMVGRYGEIVLIDLGISRQLDAGRRDPASASNGAIDAEPEGERARLFATRVGSLIGTPAYMSPEQARGDHANLDARSDIYSAIVVLHELIGLRHYLADETTLDGLLEAVKSRPFAAGPLFFMSYPQGMPPAELLHLCAKGLAKDPAARFQSASELISRLHEVLQGQVKVQCPCTLTKRVYREAGRLVDRSPGAGILVLFGIVAAVVFSAVQLARMVL